MNSADKTTIRRLPERGTGDPEVVNAILDEGFVCHVGYITEGRPVVIPMLYARDGERIIIHGSHSSGIARAVRSGSPLSIAVTLVDGIVVARSGFHSSANYRSVVIHGEGRILTGSEHEASLDRLVEALIPGRVADMRAPRPKELQATAAIEVKLDEASAKLRTGGPVDDPEDMGGDAWAGVIPLQMTAGEPVPSADLSEGIEVPEYLRPYRRLSGCGG